MPWTLPRTEILETEERIPDAFWPIVKESLGRAAKNLVPYVKGKIPGTIPQGIKELYTALPEIMERTDRFVRTDSGDYDPRVLDLALEALGGSIPGGAKGASSLGIARKDFAGSYRKQMMPFIGKERNMFLAEPWVLEQFGPRLKGEEIEFMVDSITKLPQYLYDQVTGVKTLPPGDMMAAAGRFDPKTGIVSLGRSIRDLETILHELWHGMQYPGLEPESWIKTREQQAIFETAEKVRNVGLDLYFEGIERLDGSTMTDIARHDFYDPFELGANRTQRFPNRLKKLTKEKAHEYMTTQLLEDTKTVMAKMRKEFPAFLKVRGETKEIEGFLTKGLRQ